MQKPSWLATNLNLPTILTLLVMGASGVTWATRMEGRLDAAENYRIERSQVTDKAFDNIAARLSDLSNVPYRVTALEQANLDMNQRLQHLTDTLLSSMDGIRKDVNTVGTKVEVLSQKIDTLSARRQPTRIELAPTLPPERRAALQFE